MKSILINIYYYEMLRMSKQLIKINISKPDKEDARELIPKLMLFVHFYPPQKALTYLQRYMIELY